MPNFAVFESFEEVTSLDRVLYHGSRRSIVGDIAPRSRPGTDFGGSFCMGADTMQTKGLVAGESQPVSYALSVDFSGIVPEQVLIIDRHE